MRHVPYNENWGVENRDANLDRSSAPDRFALGMSDVKTLLVVFSELSPIEQRVFIFQFCDQIYEPSEIALRLGWRSRGSAQTVQKRLKKKLGRLQQSMRGPINLNPEKKGEEDNADAE